jgi:hypothetical protein
MEEFAMKLSRLSATIVFFTLILVATAYSKAYFFEGKCSGGGSWWAVVEVNDRTGTISGWHGRGCGGGYYSVGKMAQPIDNQPEGTDGEPTIVFESEEAGLVQSWIFQDEEGTITGAASVGDDGQWYDYETEWLE